MKEIEIQEYIPLSRAAQEIKSSRAIIYRAREAFTPPLDATGPSININELPRLKEGIKSYRESLKKSSKKP